MKFYMALGAILTMASVAQADIMWRLADIAIIGTGAIPPEKIVKSNASPLEAGAGMTAAGVMAVGGVAGYSMAMTRYQANEVLNTASMLAIVAMSANGGEGQKLTLAEAEESGIKSEICNIDMASDEKGNVKITFGEDCQTKGGEIVHMKAVQEQVEKIVEERASCSENVCFIKGL